VGGVAPPGGGVGGVAPPGGGVGGVAPPGGGVGGVAPPGGGVGSVAPRGVGGGVGGVAPPGGGVGGVDRPAGEPPAAGSPSVKPDTSSGCRVDIAPTSLADNKGEWGFTPFTWGMQPVWSPPSARAPGFRLNYFPLKKSP